MSIVQSADDYRQLSAKATYTPPKLEPISLATEFFMQAGTTPTIQPDFNNILDFDFFTNPFNF